MSLVIIIVIIIIIINNNNNNKGRLITFNVVVSDRPGGIAELAKLISSMGVSIKVNNSLTVDQDKP